MLFPGVFAALFTSDVELMEYTKTALRIYMGGMFLFGIQMACQMTFNALGRAAESIVVAVMRKFDPVDLSHASHLFRGQNHGGLYGGAHRGYPGSDLYGDSVRGSV